MDDTKKHRTLEEIRAEREALDKLYREAQARLSDEESAARSAVPPSEPSPVVAVWRLKMKQHVFEREGGDGFRTMYTVRYADGTGNTFHPAEGAYDPVTGLTTDRTVPMEPFFHEGIPFDREPSNWLGDDHLYDIVRIKPEGMPPIDRS